MRITILALLLAMTVGCSFSATTRSADVEFTPNVASYDIDLKVVKSAGSVEIPLGDKAFGWVGSVIGAAKDLLSKVGSDSSPDGS